MEVINPIDQLIFALSVMWKEFDLNCSEEERFNSELTLFNQYLWRVVKPPLNFPLSQFSPAFVYLFCSCRWCLKLSILVTLHLPTLHSQTYLFFPSPCPVLSTSVFAGATVALFTNCFASLVVFQPPRPCTLPFLPVCPFVFCLCICLLFVSGFLSSPVSLPLSFSSLLVQFWLIKAMERPGLAFWSVCVAVCLYAFWFSAGWKTFRERV